MQSWREPISSPPSVTSLPVAVQDDEDCDDAAPANRLRCSGAAFDVAAPCTPEQVLGRHAACQLACLDAPSVGSGKAARKRTRNRASPLPSLRYLRMAAPPSAQLCGTVRQLAVLDLSACGDSLAQAPQGLGGLAMLRLLHLNGCAHLTELPVQDCLPSLT